MTEENDDKAATFLDTPRSLTKAERREAQNRREKLNKEKKKQAKADYIERKENEGTSNFLWFIIIGLIVVIALEVKTGLVSALINQFTGN